MKKVIVASSILLSLFLSACATNFGSIGSNSLSTDNDLSNTSEVNHDSDDNQQHIDEEDFLIYCLPQEFYYQDIQYEMKTGVRLDDSDIADFLGYFINLEDVEKWKEKDDSCNIVYVIDIDNSIYHYDLTGELLNRFELFTTHNQNEIALKACGDFLSYQAKEVIK